MSLLPTVGGANEPMQVTIGDLDCLINIKECQYEKVVYYTLLHPPTHTHLTLSYSIPAPLSLYRVRLHLYASFRAYRDNYLYIVIR